MNKIFIYSIIVLIVFFIGLILWYFISPLFLDKVVNEENIIGNNQNTTESASILYSGTFVDADNFHKTSGKAKIIEIGENKYLRLEDFKSTNGPDLKVYLASDIKASEYVSLGDLKGNIGDQNYEINEKIDFETYDHVLIWCEQFSVLFGSTELSN